MNYRSYIPLIVLLIVLIWQIGLTVGGDQIGNDPRSALKFSHLIHVQESGMSCSDCHSQAVQSTKTDDRLIPAMEVCGSCHDIKDPDKCSICHRNPQQVRPTPARVEYYDFFNHQKHLQKDLTCESCHAGASGAGQIMAVNTLLPPMPVCMDCHRKKGQTVNCSSCHQGAHPISGDLNFMSWRQTHGIDASSDPDKYQHYFEPGDCEDCHQGLNLAGEVHQQGWLFIHGAESSSGGECLACHEDRTYCSSCHRLMLPIPHPLGDPSFANSEGGRHTSEAKAFIEACISCHDVEGLDPTCARCH
jgi:hypothetical protein